MYVDNQTRQLIVFTFYIILIDFEKYFIIHSNKGTMYTIFVKDTHEFP